MTLPYETIFSRVRNKITDPKELSLDANDLIEIYTERLHSAVGDQRVRTLFSSISLDDEIQEITYEMDISIDETTDTDFVIEMLSSAIAIEWMLQQVNSRLYTSQMIGGKEEKKLIDNYKPMIGRLESMRSELYRKIRDYGTHYNSYLREDEV